VSERIQKIGNENSKMKNVIGLNKQQQKLINSPDIGEDLSNFHNYDEIDLMNSKQDGSFKPENSTCWSNLPFTQAESQLKSKLLFEANPFTPDQGLKESFDPI